MNSIKQLGTQCKETSRHVQQKDVNDKMMQE